MILHLAQGEGAQQIQGELGGRRGADVTALEVTDGPLTGLGPPDEQERRAESTARSGFLVDQRAHGVRLSVAPPEGRGPLVHPQVAAQGRVVAQWVRSDSLTRLPRMNVMLAGRSASRRIR